MKLIGIDALGLSSLSYSFDCCKTLEMHEFAESFSFVMGDVFRRMEDNPLRLDNIFMGCPRKPTASFVARPILFAPWYEPLFKNTDNGEIAIHIDNNTAAWIC